MAGRGDCLGRLFVGLRYVSAGWSILVGAPTIPADVGGGGRLHPDAASALRRIRIVARTSRGAGQRRVDPRTAATAPGAGCSCSPSSPFMSPAWTPTGTWSACSRRPARSSGDVLLAIVLAYGLVAPISVTWRIADAAPRTPGLELVPGPRGPGQGRPGSRSSLVHWWLMRRMRAALRRSQVAAARRRRPWAGACGAGLPAAAILMALTPLWGVSWFFDTETWVTGAWEMWAEQRTDTWRVEMVEAVKKEYGDAGRDPDFFRVSSRRTRAGPRTSASS